MKAFPNHRSEGMDLRDYFAAACIKALITNPELMSNPENEDMSMSQICDWAYSLADSMLEARKDD